MNPNMTYEKPSIVDYGSLVELTANSGLNDIEDGIGKILNTDGSPPSQPGFTH
jgi:hypothetical protein